MRPVSLTELRLWRPPSCGEPVCDLVGQQLRRLFPGVVLSRESRAVLREFAIGVLEEAAPIAADRFEALLTLEFCAWSQAVVERRTLRPFAGWLKETIIRGEAFQISDDPEVEKALRLAFGLPVPPEPKVARKSRAKKIELAAIA